jgi:hypothetical protein
MAYVTNNLDEELNQQKAGGGILAGSGGAANQALNQAAQASLTCKPISLQTRTKVLALPIRSQPRGRRV